MNPYGAFLEAIGFIVVLCVIVAALFCAAQGVFCLAVH